MNEQFFAWNQDQFNPGQNQSGFFQDVGTGVGNWVEGWGQDNLNTAEYNAAVVEQKRNDIQIKKQIVSSMLKVVGLFAIVLAVVLVVKAFKK